MPSRTATWNWLAVRAWPEPRAGLTGLALLAWAWPAEEAAAWTVKALVLAVLLAGLAASSLARAAVEGEASPVLVPFLALAGWMLVSVMWSNDPVRGWGEGLVAAWAVLAAFTARSRDNGWGPVVVIVGVALLEAGVGAWQANIGGGGRLNGTFVNATHHAALLACGWGAAVALALTGRPGRMAVFSVIGFILMAAASQSGSRSVVLAAVAVILVAARLRPAGSTRARLVVTAVLTAIALATPGGVAGRLSAQSAGKEPRPWGRLELWASSLRMVRGVPIIGVGAGGFADAFPAVRPPSFAAIATDYAHDEPLQVACETGIVGTGLLGLALAALWRAQRPGKSGRRIRRVRGRRPSGVDAVNAARLLALTSLAVFALTDFPAHVPTLGLFALALAMPVEAALSVRQSRAETGCRTNIFLALGMSVLVFGSLTLWMGLRSAADLEHLKGTEQASLGDMAGAQAYFRSAQVLFRDHAESMHALAELEPGELEARQGLERVARLRPDWMPPVVTSFERALAAGDERSATAALGRASRLDPYGLSVILMRVRWLGRQGKYGEARRELDKAEKGWPRQLDVMVERARLLEAEKDTEDCRMVLREILRVFPGNVVVRKWLSRLGK